VTQAQAAKTPEISVQDRADTSSGPVWDQGKSCLTRNFQLRWQNKAHRSFLDVTQPRTAHHRRVRPRQNPLQLSKRRRKKTASKWIRFVDASLDTAHRVFLKYCLHGGRGRQV